MTDYLSINGWSIRKKLISFGFSLWIAEKNECRVTADSFSDMLIKMDQADNPEECK